MRLAFLSNNNPADRQHWSGTTSHIFNTLQSHHEVDWLGGGIVQGALWHHKLLGRKGPFYPEDYTAFFSRILSRAVNEGNYDAVFVRDYYLGAELETDTPLVYITDATFDLFRHYLGIEDGHYARLAEHTEQRLADRADLLVYATEWARRNAVEHYHVPAGKTAVVEFGANIPAPDTIEDDIQTEQVNLLFVGRDFEKKGGRKAIAAFRNLQRMGVNCTLTIVGCQPKEDLDGIRVFPRLDKDDPLQLATLQRLYSTAHFLILPTQFDAFGIVFCEAAAYGVPSIAANVGGVSQPVRDGVNGFLMPPDATAEDYAEKMASLLADKDAYRALRRSARRDFETRLNWTSWGRTMDKLLEELAEEARAMEADSFFLPAYAINLKERKERRKHIMRQFKGKDEFELTVVDAEHDRDGRRGLWLSLVKIVAKAVEKGEDVIVVCEDDHEFTPQYSANRLFSAIAEAEARGAELLTGGIGGYGQTVPAGGGLYWVDWFWCTQFIVLFKPVFRKILDYKFTHGDTTDGVLSKIVGNKLVMYPFVSVQRDFGYSDVTESNDKVKGLITNHFVTADARMSVVSNVYHHYLAQSILQECL